MSLITNLKKVKKMIFNKLFLSKKEQRHYLVGAAHLWEMKQKFQINFLKENGLKPEDKLVDIGCGTLRGGIPLIEYLNEGNYCGLEVRADVLNEGRKELKEEGLENKKPELVHFNDFNELHFDTKFDMAFAFSVLIHLDDDIAEKCFDFVGRHLSEKGVFFANVNLSERESGNWQGFPVMYKELSFYENFAAKNNLVVKNLGALKDLGHISNQPVADEQIMLAFSRK
jgi:SAM-dependent methyltransferase